MSRPRFRGRVYDADGIRLDGGRGADDGPDVDWQYPWSEVVALQWPVRETALFIADGPAPLRALPPKALLHLVNLLRAGEAVVVMAADPQRPGIVAAELRACLALATTPDADAGHA